MTASGCGGDEDFFLPDWDAPGRNARVGDLVIRYAHVAVPLGEPWQPGDDVPAYVGLHNMSDQAGNLVGASTPNAASVDIVDSDSKPLPGGVDLPVNQLVELEQGKAHLVLRDVRRLIRGGDFMKFTMRFENAGSITCNVQSQIPSTTKAPPRRGEPPTPAVGEWLEGGACPPCA
ncbi:copper chaperone PCu(A)C [Streptomyces sp. DH10]|uniref:copper chaperone PCu(A)C n=1 Tax=Streptomyces sp. DH10 TaxID=3040121 RepID=UPI0024427863|nr:copper chaperone PCu(A)C [Streptomyces sp. DH10]MDG9711345.1 copper chaperone PCu(A)C [Streptomyces sp. DH10]